MNRQEQALLAEHIFHMMLGISDFIYPANFKGVLYLKLQEEIEGQLKSDNYHSNNYENDFNGYHRFRGNQASAKRANLSLQSFELIEPRVNGSVWSTTFSNGSKYEVMFSSLEDLDDETIQYWLELGLFEIQHLMDYYSKLNTVLNPEHFEEFEQPEDARYSAFFSIYESLCGLYSSSSSREKSFIEVTLGAALFYLPQPVAESWTGQVSLSALKGAISDRSGIRSFVKDHIYSRKRAAYEVLNNHYSIDRFRTEYEAVFRKFSYLTASQNRYLVNWHIDHDSYEEALLNASVYMVNLSEANIRHRDLNSFIHYCKQLDDIEWSNELEIFRSQIIEASNSFIGRN